MKSRWLYAGAALVATVMFVLVQTDPGTAQQKKGKAKKGQAERGAYLVNLAGCNDCHSPKIFTPKGPIPDTTKLLSGHPSTSVLTDIPKDALGPEKWGGLFTNDLTGWAGPWGVSFARNLTPDVGTGLGSWTEDIFIKAIRTGKDMGEGRDILPPMPWPFYAQLKDEDLKAIFAYLQSLPPIENAVPDPISPTGEHLPTLSSPKK